MSFLGFWELYKQKPLSRDFQSQKWYIFGPNSLYNNHDIKGLDITYGLQFFENYIPKNNQKKKNGKTKQSLKPLKRNLNRNGDNFTKNR